MAYILRGDLCESCIWSESGFYNAICAHCPCCTYGKELATSYMSRETAEAAGLIKERKEDTGRN